MSTFAFSSRDRPGVWGTLWGVSRGTPLADAWKAAGRGCPGGAPEWEEALRTLFTEGQTALAGLEVSEQVFAAHVAKVLPQGPASSLAGLSGEGLNLAAACLANLPGALERFDRTVLFRLRTAVARMDGGEALADDVEQHLRVLLFAPAEGKRSLLLTYSGKGALGSWLKVVGVREAQRLRKAAPISHDPDDALADLPAQGADPELRFLKFQYRNDFKAAFGEAMSSLDDRGRAVLRMSLLQNLSVDEVGKVYSVHRATAARWIAAAREQLIDGTRARLAERLGLQSKELKSLMGLVKSNLSISLTALERQE
jgi:RNA polymerase sigma-70 factor, ECF subfamily